MVKMKPHPTLGIMVRSDGMVLRPSFRRFNKVFQEEWTFGKKDVKGYRYICINRKKVYIHRLVAETFIENPLNKPFIDHKNQNREYNDISNLGWVTVQENGYNRKDNIPNVKRCDLSKKEYDKIIRDRQLAKMKEAKNV